MSRYGHGVKAARVFPACSIHLVKRDAYRDAPAGAHVPQHQVHIQNAARAVLVMLAFGYGDRLVFLAGFKIDVRFAGILPGLGPRAQLRPRR